MAKSLSTVYQTFISSLVGLILTCLTLDVYASSQACKKSLQNQSFQLNSSLNRLAHKRIPTLERQATKSNGYIVDYFESIDKSLRNNPEVPSTLTELVVNRLPFIKETGVNIILSGGPAKKWGPIIVKRAKELGVSANIIQVPGSLSPQFGQTQRNDIPNYSLDVTEQIQNRPTVFFDDSYSSGKTALKVKESVLNTGGFFEGVFVAYNGGKGNASSIYHATRKNKTQTSHHWFERSPVRYKLNPKIRDKGIGLQINSTLVTGHISNTSQLTPQGEALLKLLANLGVPTTLYKNNKAISVESLDTDIELFHYLTETNNTAEPALLFGNFGGDFYKNVNTFITTDIPTFQTPRIGNSSKDGRMNYRNLEPDYLINKLVEIGVLIPDFGSPNFAVDPDYDKNTSHTYVLTSPERKSNNTSLYSYVFKSTNPRQMTSAINNLNWEVLTPTQKNNLISHARTQNNSYVIGAYIHVAKHSKDMGWNVFLQEIIDAYSGSKQSWKSYQSQEAQDALEHLEETIN